MRENLNKILDTVVQALSAFRTEANIYFASQEKKAEADAARVEELDKRQAGLDVREKAVKSYEDIKKQREEANKLSADARDRMDALQKEQDRFDNYVKKVSKEINDAKIANSNRTDELNAEYKALESQRAAFVKEKDDYKLKLAKGLVDRVG